ncbi:bifunctional folylpolyglutamate synthase/dihydrofolate synthase [Bacillus horti]|uniref:tetrahydrofolate synthase n=1 Tax=Caldalkalibacillus horti TaxID=77523 RepID=A0ABT9VTI3_9BACI|nr:folylpolyglutamate synthase/dihydrofolate synthase family protein [Bacillus horti]MDQ0164296.1 dihydrofolate synthase/folylpolyglutamate synthase [Bacillus horti]
MTQQNSKLTSAEQAIEWIHSLTMLGIKPGLKRMEWMLEQLGHPERRLKFIHIGGTNGKGSTVAYLRHVLETAGFDVGAFTSPYIERFQNRIQLNGHDIPDESLLELCQRIQPLAKELEQSELGGPTEFEVVTMLAILYFATVSYPDFVLWEVGLGGRLDSTNVVTPILSIITNIGYDHMHILGNSLEEITLEKAGIIKPGVPLVTGIQQAGLLEIIHEKAKENKTTVYALNGAFHVKEGSFSEESQYFSYSSMFASYPDLCLSMMGAHQINNAALAVMALQVLKQYYAVVWEEQDLYKGLKQTSWIGRMEKLQDEPLTLIDGAHNQQGMEAFQDTLQRYYKDKSVTVIFAASKGKDLEQMLTCLNGLVERVIVTTFSFPRAHSIEELQELKRAKRNWSFKLIVTEEWQEYYQQYASQNKDSENNADNVLFFTGSLYFISEVRSLLLT